jgi:hypothetical protein
MKIVIALATLMTAAQVFAQTSSSDLSFGDVNYFLKTGQFDFILDSTYERKSFQNANYNPGQPKDSYHARGFINDMKLGFGLSSNINLFLASSYRLNYKTSPITGGTSSSSGVTEDGFTNPQLGGTWRVVNQNDTGINWDIGVVGTFKIQDAEKGSLTAKSDGNAWAGNNSLEVNTSLGKKWNEANEWRLTLGAIQSFDGEYTNKKAGTAGADVDVDTDGSTDWYARALYQYRPVYEFMLTVGVQANLAGEKVEREKNDTVNETRTAETHLDYDFIFNARYMIQENVIIRFNSRQSRLANYDIDNSQANANFTVNRRRQLDFGLGVDYLF